MATDKANIRVDCVNQLLCTHDLQKMIDLARPIYGNPLIVSNGSYTVLAISEEPDIEDPRWKEIQSTKGVPLGVATNSGINECYRKSMETHRPAEDRDDQGIPILRKVLADGNRILGYLDSPAYIKPVEKEDVEFFDLLANLLAVELQWGSGDAAPPDNMLDYFVYDLLKGNITDQGLIKERLDYFQWGLFDKGKVQIVSVRGRKRDLMPDNTLFRHLMEEFSTAFPGFRVFVYVNQLKMLCPVSEDVRGDERFLEQLEELLVREELVAGISRPLISLETIPDFNRQAESAAELGRRFHPERTIHFYDSYAIYYALELVGSKENMLQFCHSAIILLRDYDRAHETDLLESLRVYLTHNRSIGESAAALYIHRNTMNYRIARINELTGVDLSDPDVFCHLLFSFYALDYRKEFSEERVEGMTFHPRSS